MFDTTFRRTLIGAALLMTLGLSGLAQHAAHPTPAAPTTAKATTPKAAAAKAAPAKPAGTLPLRATNATVVAVPPTIRETSVFATLTNTGKTPVVLTGVQASVSGHAMLMVTTKSPGGMLGMQMAETLTVPAGGRLVLSHSGDHVMLMKLRRALKVGERLQLTLSAADGRTYTFQATVKKP